MATYHRPLEAELPRLVALAEQVQDPGADGARAFSSGLLQTLRALEQSLLDHMLKEEQILFPLISSGQGAEARVPVEVMEAEHDEAVGYVARLRDLTGDYAVPEGASEPVRALWAGLAALDLDLQAHMWLEDEVLFRRALSSPA